MTDLKPTNKLQRFCLLMALCILLITAFSSLGASPVFAEGEKEAISQLEAEKQLLNEKIKETDAQIAQTKAKLNSEKDKQKRLEQEITGLEEQQGLYLQKISMVTSEIELKDIEIEQKEAEIRVSEARFADRVHAMYVNQVSDSTMNTLISAKSFTELLNRVEYLKKISETDEQIIKDLAAEKTELGLLREGMEVTKSELEQTKAELDLRVKQTEQLYNESEAAESELLEKNRQYAQERQKYATEIKEIEAEVDRLIALLSTGSESYGSGILAWPLPGKSRISSPFGWRVIFGQREFHTGIDIPAAAGTNIKAADSGKVLFVKKNQRGYGWHLAVDHGMMEGKSIVTLYAHASRIDVAANEFVLKGQTIAGVGTTGTSTGNHLHFEVRVNQEKVNPLNYVSPS